MTETDTAAWEGTLLELFGQLAEGYRTADRPTRRALECEAAEIGETWLLAHVGYPCNDCATPTMQSEYYMVNDAIWRAAGHDVLPPPRRARSRAERGCSGAVFSLSLIHI